MSTSHGTVSGRHGEYCACPSKARFVVYDYDRPGGDRFIAHVNSEKRAAKIAALNELAKLFGYTLVAK